MIFGKKKKRKDTGADKGPNQHSAETEGRGSADEGPMASMPETIREAVRAAGWKELMPVQKMAIPVLLKRRDLIMQSRTGSGKTGAFLLPLRVIIKDKFKDCQSLILVPTRELAKQVAEQARLLTAGTDIHVAEVYGGVGYGKQIEAFKNGAQIVIGTPGRLIDHLSKGNLSLGRVKALVLDEADRLLSMGFYPDMKEILRYFPKNHVQTCLFSATYPETVKSLAREFTENAEILSLSTDHVHVTDIAHQYCVVEPMKKDRILLRLIEIDNPESGLIFCNTKSQVHYLAQALQNFGYHAAELSSDLSQGKREQIIHALRKKKLRFVVATDVAARGIDIPVISHVFLYDLPDNPEDYIHRTGRTGRAGASGTVIALVSIIEQLQLNRIAKKYGIELDKRDPTEEKTAQIVAQRLMVHLETRMRHLDAQLKERMERFSGLAGEMTADEKSREKVAFLLDDFYQREITASEDFYLAGESSRDSGRHDGNRSKRRSKGRSGGRNRQDSGGKRSGSRHRRR